MVFLPDYRVSLAEQIITAADLSEQISAAGYEASGTSNMKFMMNGALTIGTLDGANIEMLAEVGSDNIFVFGLDASQIQALRPVYAPRAYYEGNPLLREAIDLLRSGRLCGEAPSVFGPLLEGLLTHDPYFVLADFAAYLSCQAEVSQVFRDRAGWTRRAIINVARSGRFSSDRTIAEYNRDIWRAQPVPIPRERERPAPVARPKRRTG